MKKNRKNQNTGPARTPEAGFNSTNVIDQYLKQYADIHFERCGLFQAVLDEYQPQEILYPGCSIHITPSFYYPHVVYIDNSEQALNFFTGMPQIEAFIERKKVYRQSAFFRFIAQDYLLPLPLEGQLYDMLLVLYTADAVSRCMQYLKPGGILLVQEVDIDKISRDVFKKFEPVSTIHFSKGKYKIEKLTENTRSPAHRKNKKFLHQTNQGLVYQEAMKYHLYQKTMK